MASSTITVENNGKKIIVVNLTEHVTDLMPEVTTAINSTINFVSQQQNYSVFLMQKNLP